jgi:hypothetical protein
MERVTTLPTTVSATGEMPKTLRKKLELLNLKKVSCNISMAVVLQTSYVVQIFLSFHEQLLIKFIITLVRPIIRTSITLEGK